MVTMNYSEVVRRSSFVNKLRSGKTLRQAGGILVSRGRESKAGLENRIRLLAAIGRARLLSSR